MSSGLHVKYPLFLSYLNGTWIFSIDFSKSIQISNFTTSRVMAAELSHAVRRDEANSHISHFRESA